MNVVMNVVTNVVMNVVTDSQWSFDIGRKSTSYTLGELGKYNRRRVYIINLIFLYNKINYSEP